MRVATMHASLGLLLVLTPQTAADWSAGKDEDPDSLQSMWSAWMRPDQVENANILAGVHTKSTTTSRHHPPPPAPPDTSEHPDCAPACRRDWAENCPKPGCLTCRTCERLFLPRHPPPAIPSPKPPPPAAPPWCTDSLDMRTDARTISNPGGPLGKWCHQLQEEDCENSENVPPAMKANVPEAGAKSIVEQLQATQDPDARLSLTSPAEA